MALVHSISHTSLPNILTLSVPSLSSYVVVTVMDNHHSVQFSCSVMSDSLWPQELQHARPHCPSPTPRVHSNSCPSSQWCHPAISSSVFPFSCPRSLPASGSFSMNQLFEWGGQSIGVSALASVLPMNTQDRSPLEWTGWVSLHFLFQWLLGILAWKIPWTEEPGGLQCRGLQRIWKNWATEYTHVHIHMPCSVVVQLVQE